MSYPQSGLIMPVVEHTADIKASRTAVFSLVNRVEAFADYSDAIDTIERLSDDRYVWRLRVAGVPLRFDVEITQSTPPERFMWRSVSGVPCHGCFQLQPIEGGTRIHFTLVYRLGNRLFENTVHLAAAPLLRRLSQEIIQQLEKQLPPPPPDPR